MTGLEDRYAPPPRFADAAEKLHELVASQLGDGHFGPPDYKDGLAALLLSMDYDPHFSERGRRIAWGELYNGLFGRAHAYKSSRENPGAAANTITKPLIITGIPRTGTTALHKLLAVDPQFQGLQTWLTATPQPRPPRETWESNPLFQNAVERIAARHAAKPSGRASHDMAAEEVDECCLIMRQGFVSNLWTCAWSAPSYDLWLQTQTEKHCYAHLHRALQLIGANEPNKRWLLKNPGHIATLDLLLETFPDALVVQTHRDPAKAVPSLCSHLINNHDVLEAGRRDLRAHLMGARETEKWAKAIRDAEPVRKQYASQILDVIHADFHCDPLAIIERIYAFADLTLSPAVRTAMQARIADDPEGKHGVHRYDAADFGLSEDSVRERFGDYVQRFDLVRKRV
jgi:hypothetical protein